MPHKIAVEVLGGRIAHTLFEAHDFAFLRGHIDNDISRQAVFGVFQPFENIAVSER